MSRASIRRVVQKFDLECSDIAPDKSISHRCAIFSLLSDRVSKITNFLRAEDTLASLHIAQLLGAQIEDDGTTLFIKPPDSIVEPFDILDCGNAGTGMRLYCGLLSGINGSFVLTGDKYLRNRPMNRVVKPLRTIGAKIDGREEGNKAPLHIRGGNLESFIYNSPIDSAQVKSALILAALNADGKSYYHENFLSRDHTERMLLGMGANIKKTLRDNQEWIEIAPLQAPLEPLNIRVPADPSSGFFFAVAAAIVPDATILIRDVTLNPTRIEAYKVLEKMGADIEYQLKEDKYEPIGDIKVTYNGQLKGVDIDSNIAWLIDELPALAIAMSVANGSSIVKNAKELRVKESDRIDAVVTALRECGIAVDEYEDGYKIYGGSFKKAKVDSFGDHRIAMSFAIAGLLVGMEIEDIACVDTSFPNFFDILNRITRVDIENRVS